MVSKPDHEKKGKADKVTTKSPDDAPDNQANNKQDHIPVFRVRTPELEDEETSDAPAKRDMTKDKKALAGAGEKGFALSLALLYGYDSENLDEAFGAETVSFLNSFEIVDAMTDIGGILVRPAGTQDYGFDVSPQSLDIVGITSEEMLNDQGMEALLEAALLAKTMPTAKQGLYTFHDNKTVLQAINKASELAGVRVMNEGAAGGTLEQNNPELAQRMEAAWVRVQAKHNLTPQHGAAPSAPRSTAEQKNALTETTEPAAPAAKTGKSIETADSAPHPPMADMPSYEESLKTGIMPSFLLDKQEGLAGEFGANVHAQPQGETQKQQKLDTSKPLNQMSPHELDKLVESIPAGAEPENVISTPNGP